MPQKGKILGLEVGFPGKGTSYGKLISWVITMNSIGFP